MSIRNQLGLLVTGLMGLFLAFTLSPVQSQIPLVHVFPIASFTPLPPATFTLTATYTLSPTPPPTATMISTSGSVAIVKIPQANLRSGPSNYHNVMNTVTPGEQFPIVAQAYNTPFNPTPQMTWYQIIAEHAGALAWISADSVDVLPSNGEIDFTGSIPAVQSDVPNSISRNELIELYTGAWANLNVDTQSITQIDLWFQDETPYMHWYRACQPTDCDNGIHPGEQKGNNLYFIMDYDYAVIQFGISYSESTLWVTSATNFNDNSGRLPYTVTEGFSLLPSYAG